MRKSAKNSPSNGTGLGLIRRGRPFPILKNLKLIDARVSGVNNGLPLSANSWIIPHCLRPDIPLYCRMNFFIAMVEVPQHPWQQDLWPWQSQSFSSLDEWSQNFINTATHRRTIIKYYRLLYIQNLVSLYMIFDTFLCSVQQINWLYFIWYSTHFFAVFNKSIGFDPKIENLQIRFWFLFIIYLCLI